ncbi:hypothetical protein T03_12629 [Trichinella britovi]|uniref:Uncharacterized protein n=1 Tax=Trichinella britovi TaxID=45882 RepID=A0A0V1CGF7_TRIBR|nr:hypothetical protein T03_12629 [Trichinella britovi]
MLLHLSLISFCPAPFPPIGLILSSRLTAFLPLELSNAHILLSLTPRMSWSLAICIWTTLPTVGNVCFDNDTSRPPSRAGHCKTTLAYDEPPNRWRYPSLSAWTGVVTTEWFPVGSHGSKRDYAGEVLQIMIHVSEKRLRWRNADENRKKQSKAGAQYKTEPEERPSVDCAWRARSVRSVAVERVRALVVLKHCFVCLLDRRSADKVCYSQDCIL